MGEKVQLGKLVYNVYESQWLTQLGEGTAARIPENRYFLIRVSVANAGSGEIMVPNMSITDDNGNTYQELSSGDGVPQWIGFLRAARPNQPLQGNVVFDCAPRNYKLRISGENEKSAAFVEIPLSFGTETPELPIPETPQKQ